MSKYTTLENNSTTSVVVPTTTPQVTLDKVNTAPQAERRKRINTKEQADRRKAFREVSAFADDMMRAMHFKPIDRQTALAIITRINEQGGAPDAQRWVTLAAIGQGLSSKSDDLEAVERTARNRVGHLFNHAIPYSGYQIITRYMAEEGSRTPHAFADHLTPVASLFSELLAEEVAAINSNKKLDTDAKTAAKHEARARLVEESLTYLPKCEVEVFLPAVYAEDGQIELKETRYAYMSTREAENFCAKRPALAARPMNYVEPAVKQPKQFYAEDFSRLKRQAVRQAVDSILNAIGERNGKLTARRFWIEELFPALEHAGERWLNQYRENGEGEENYILGENPDTKTASDPHGSMGGEGEKFSPSPSDNSNEDSNIVFQNFDTVDLGASAEARAHGYVGPGAFLQDGDQEPDAEPAPVASLPEASINFDDSLSAALFYVNMGFAVVPTCRYNEATGRCDGPATHQKKGCGGRTPLLSRKDPKPGDGYMATRDKGAIHDYYTRLFKGAGVALRLDNEKLGPCILIDCDVKNGARGLESYEYLCGTFGLDETLAAVSHSGGRHYVFRLPEGFDVSRLKSWTDVLANEGLGGIDIKVDVRGLMHVEPTKGSKGVYRWVDVTVEIATLPVEVCEYFIEVHNRDMRTPEQKAADEAKAAIRAASPSVVGPFDPSDEAQAKFFKDVARGAGQHKRLLHIARCIRGLGAGVEDIIKVLSYHAARFSEPFTDLDYIKRAARECVAKFGQGAPR